MEVLSICIFSVFMTFICIAINNRDDICAEKTVRDKIKCYMKIRKNSLISLILGIGGGIGLGILSYCYYMDNLEYTIKLIFVFEIMIPVAYIDYQKRIIPNRIILLLLVAYTAFFVLEITARKLPALPVIKFSLWGMLLGGGTFILCAVISRGGMGMGDIKLFSVLGLYFGWQGIFNIILYSVLCISIYGIYNMARHKMNRKTEVPIGPSALIGVVGAILLGV